MPIPDGRLETLPIFDEPFWFAEPKGRKPANAKIMMEEELRGRRLLLLTEGALPARSGPGDLRDGGAGRPRGISARPSLETILQMVATGLGSTLLPAMACSKAHGRSLTMRPLEAGLGRRVGLAWRRSYPRPG